MKDFVVEKLEERFDRLLDRIEALEEQKTG